VFTRGHAGKSSDPEKVELTLNRTTPTLQGSLVLEGVPKNPAGFPGAYTIPVTRDVFDYHYSDGKKITLFEIKVSLRQDASCKVTIRKKDKTAGRDSKSDREPPILDVLLKKNP
jgi:hypothetical protein